MNKQKIKQLKNNFDEYLHILQGSGIEFCYARELMGLLGYAHRENFFRVINRSKTACKNSKIEVPEHFRDITKMLSIGSVYE